MQGPANASADPPAPRNIGKKGVQGAAWTIGAGVAARALGVIGTLLLMRFVAPNEYGEVQVASVITASAQQFTILGLGTYVITHPRAGREMVFHATAYFLALGALAMLAVLLLRQPLGPLFDAPNSARYVPGLVLSCLLDRVGYMPERLMVRDLRFRQLSLIRSSSEVLYAVVTVATAALGMGAMAVVWGNIARSALRCALFCGMVDPREWLTPCRLRRDKSRELFAFGIPVSIGAMAGFASKRWDNLLVSRYFGTAVVGEYNVAYNLAEIPTSLVGEQIGDVLMPSFAHMEESRIAPALLRATSLLSLMMFPLAIGLAAIAPTLTATLLDKRWESVGPMLMLLSGLAVSRPYAATVNAFMQVRNHPRLAMVLDIFLVVALLGSIASLGGLGPHWACGAVGLAYGLRALLALVTVRFTDGIPFLRSLGTMVPPLLACIPMAAAVLLIRRGLMMVHHENGVIALASETIVGGIVYVAAAFVVARPVAIDFLTLVKNALLRRK